MNLVDLVAGKLDIERVWHQPDVLNCLNANDREYVGRLVE